MADGPTWSDRPGAHGITYWDYAATWEREVARPPADGGPILLSRQETVTALPGTPMVAEFGPVNTPGPIPQITTGQRTSRAVVTGQLVGAYAAQLPPAGLPDVDPTVLWEAPPEVTIGSAVRAGDSFTDFLTRWTYRYVAVGPIALLPREWPG